MYAIIKAGGKQFIVEEKTVFDMDLIDAEPGTLIEFKEIFFINDGNQSIVGAPVVDGYVVIGEVIDFVSGPKIQSLKFKRSHNTQRKFGHRQKYLRVAVKEIKSTKEKATKRA